MDIRLYLLVWTLQIALSAASTSVLRLPLPNPTENYTEEVWLYYKERIPDEPFLTLYDPDRSEVQISSSQVQLSTKVFDSGAYIQATIAQDLDVLPKLRRWMHIATRFKTDGTAVKCAVLVNGMQYSCVADLVRSKFKIISEQHYLLRFTSNNFEWWNHVYYRNYRLWNGALSEYEINSVMLNSTTTLLDGYRALCFYRFANGDPVQQDVVTNGSYWLLDPDRQSLAGADFLRVSKDFDTRLAVAGNSTDYSSVEDILLVSDTSGKSGPQLTVPMNTLASSPNVTVELWFAFETMSSQNLTILGVTTKDWKKGFGIGGVLNTTGASVACIMDTISSGAKAACGVVTPLCRSFATSVRVWHHISCARQENVTGRLTFDGDSLLSSTMFSTSIGDQFSPGNIVIGARETPSTKSSGFTGYVRELRIWNRWVPDQELVSRMHLRLSPLDQGALVGYWPLTGGRDGDFFEISGHSQQSVSLDSANSASRAVYATGAYDWVRVPALWNLALCRKGYVYHRQSDSCVKKRPLMAPYFKLTSLKISADDKSVPSSFEVSMSVWVYHTSIPNLGYILEVANITSLIISNPDIVSQPTTLSAAYGNPSKSGYTKVSTNLATDPPTSRWIHYGLITSATATGLQATLYLNDFVSSALAFTAPTTFPDSLAFYVGSTLYGFIREAKVWSATITDEEMTYEQFYPLKRTDSLLGYWKFNDGGLLYASDYSDEPANAYFSPALEENAMWRYVDEEFPEEPDSGQTRAGTYYGTALPPVSFTRVPRSSGWLALNSFSLKTARSLEFWFYVYTYDSSQGYIVVNTTTAQIFLLRDLLVTSGTDPVHVLDFIAGGSASVQNLVSANYSATWQYLSINLDSTNQICLNATTSCNTFALSFADGIAVNTYLNLLNATFREVKMYSYRRSPAELKYTSHIQANPSTDQLNFYFPLTGKESTNYAFDATSPTSLISSPFTDVTWEATPDGGTLLCPPGYVHYANPLDESVPTQTPSCIEQTYLETAAAVSASLTLPSTPVWLAFSFWFMYKTNNVASFTLAEMGTPSPVSIVVTTSGSTVTVDAGPAAGRVGLTVLPMRWYHISYAFSSVIGNLYSFGSLISTNSVAHSMIASTALTLTLNLQGVNVRDMHVLEHSAEIKDFGTLMTQGYFPYSSSTKPTLFAYIPGVSMTDTNEIIVFSYSTSSPPTDTSVALSAKKTADPTATHPYGGNEKLAAKYVVGTTTESIPISKSSSLSGTETTIDFWVSLDVLASGGYFKLLSTGAYAYLEVSQSGSYRLVFEGNTENWAAVPLKWQHIAITGSSSGDKLYLDGELVDSLTHMVVSLASSTVVCTVQILSATLKMKQLRVWNVALSQNQVRQYSSMRLSVSSDISLLTVYTFEPLGALAGVFPAYQDTMKVASSVVISSSITGVSAGNNPTVCEWDEYFSGSECRSNTVLHMRQGYTPGVIVPMKTRFQKNYEWTLETWVYVYSSASTTVAAIIGLEGNWAKLSARRDGTTLVGEWSYDSMGDEMSISSFTTDTWHHVALVTTLEAPYYDAKLILDCDESTTQTVEVVIKSNVRTFDYLTLGMDRSDYDYMGRVALKEIRVWNVALDISTLKYQMRKQIRNSDAEIRLVYYYPLSTSNRENLYDQAFEGDLQDLKLWNTPHTYKTGGPDPSTITAPTITTTMELAIDPLIICDGNSFYNSRLKNCEREAEEFPIGLEQSLAPFTVPLTNYYFQVEWSVEFWLLLNQVSGVGTAVFSQKCYPAQSGTLSLKKVGTSSTFAFSVLGSGYNISFPQEKRRWNHYAFVNDVSSGRIYGYKNGARMDSDTLAVYAVIPSCALTVGEFSTMNIIYGKLKEIRLWNGTRTVFELKQDMHRTLDPLRDRSLVLYLPMGERMGQYVHERVQDTDIALTVTKYSRELWTAQGDLRICRTPYVYSPADNVCIVPRGRIVISSVTASYISATSPGPFAESETIEFWTRIYSPTSTSVVTLITQANHFTFTLSTSAATFTVNTGSPLTMTSAALTTDQLYGWIYVAGVIGLNEIKCFLMLDESAPILAAGTISGLPNYLGNNLVFGAIPSLVPAVRFVAGIREFRVWGRYSSPGQLRGERFVQRSRHAPGLLYYLPMDESSGTSIIERISGNSIAVDANYWCNQTDSTVISNSNLSPQVRDSVSLAMRDKGEIRFSVSSETYTYNELTFMLWIRLTPSAKVLIQWNGYYIFTLGIDLTMNPTTTITYNDYKTVPKGSQLSADRWNSVAFVRGSNYRKLYLNGALVTSLNEYTATVLPFVGAYVSLQLLSDSSLVGIREAKILGAALSRPEVLIEAYRRGSPWDFVGYMRYYFPLNEYPNYAFNDYAINHVKAIYTVAAASDTDPLDLLKRTMSLDTDSTNSGAAWTNEAAQPQLCEQHEVYDSDLGRCYDLHRSLMFVRGKTHPITVTTGLLEQNFTTELWIKLVNTSSGYQQIASTDYFTIRYESTGMFNATVFNGTDFASSSVASAVSPIMTWTHVGVANSELAGKSCLYVNGSEAGTGANVIINSAFSSCTLSSASNGFTGYLRELHFWNEYRPASRVHYEMHNFQWHMNGMNFNLKGYFPLNEARGVILYDYYITSPSDISDFEAATTTRIPPFWARTEILPTVCGFSQVYDPALDVCRAAKKTLGFSSSGSSLPILYDGPLRDWTFKAWVKYADLTTAGLTVMQITQLFTVQTTGVSTSIQISAPMDAGGSHVEYVASLATTVWYHISVGHSYARGSFFVEHIPVLLSLPLAVQTPPTGTDANSTYYSDKSLTIFLNNGRFMHVSLWRKYLQTVRVDSSAPFTASADLMDPIDYPSLHPDLVSYWPLEENSGTLLHDTSLYAAGPVEKSKDFSLGNVNWLYDSELEGRLAFSKHYQDTEDLLGNSNRLVPCALICTSNCNYCATQAYCKSCSLGMYLKSGACVSSSSDQGFRKDLLEREYKPIKNPNVAGLAGCDNPTCRKCSSDSTICDVPPSAGIETYCVRNAVYYFVPQSCFGSCPAGSYPTPSSSKICSSCTSNCLTCPSGQCTSCKTGYLLSSAHLCVENKFCGDGTVQDPETCDDGNTNSGDGCGKDCLIEADFTCAMLPPSGPSICTPKCGDGKFYGLNGEECDDGNTAVGDGCDGNCRIELGWWCENGSPTHKSECHCSPQHVSSLNAFSSDYMTLTFRFSRDLTVAGIPSIDLCTTLFSNYTSLFGSSAYSCVIQGKSLVLSLGSDNGIAAGTVLPLVSGILSADSSSCTETFEGSLIVPDISSQTVYGEIAVLSVVPYCDALTVWVKNLAGGLHRPYSAIGLTVSLLVSSSSDAIVLSNKESMNWALSELERQDESTYMVTVPAGTLLADAKYTLALVVTNFQNRSYASSAAFSTMSGWMATMNIQGLDADGVLSVERTEEVLIRTLPGLRRCGVVYPNASDFSVVYLQMSTAGVLNISEITMGETADRILHIPAGKMRGGVDYAFTATCKQVSTGSTVNSSAFVIHSRRSNLRAVASPASQIIPEDAGLTILGSQSYDPDNSTTLLSYSWTCELQIPEGSPCTFENGSTLGAYSTAVIAFAKSSFAPDTRMKWTLTIADSANTAVASTTALVTISYANGPSVSISGPNDTVQLGDVITLNATLVGQRLADYTFSWSVESCCSGGCIFGNNNNDFVRVVVGNVNFTSGYDFKVSVTATRKSTGISALGCLWISASPLPVAGALTIDPTEGESWSTNFTLSADGFLDPQGGKLSYAFYILKPDTAVPILISPRTESSSVLTQLPSGLETTDFTMVALVRVYNSRGGYVEAKTGFHCEPPIDSEDTVLEQYKALRDSADPNNPLDRLRQAVVGSLLLSEVNASRIITTQTGTVVCNNQGLLSNGNCVCNLDYAKRSNCSISDSEFALQTQLAYLILSDTATFLPTEPSDARNDVAFQTVLNVVSKRDLLNSTVRAMARNVLMDCTLSTSRSKEELAEAIEGIVPLSNGSAGQTEYEQQLTVLARRLVEKQLEAVKLRYGNETVETETQGFRVRSGIIRGSLGVSINMSNIVFPSTRIMLNDSDEYFVLSVVEWKTPIYTWIADYARTRSNVVSISVRTLAGAEVNVSDLSSPVGVSFPLDIPAISAEDLTALRCLYYNNSSGAYSVSGMNFSSIDVDNGIGYCQAYHLTDFVMGMPAGGAYVLPTEESADSTIFGVKVGMYSVHRSPLFWFTISFTIVCAYLSLWAYCKEKSERELTELRHSKSYAEQRSLFQECTFAEPNEASLQPESNQAQKQGSASVAACASSAQASLAVSASGEPKELTKVEPVTEEEKRADDAFRRRGKEDRKNTEEEPEQKGRDAFDTVAVPVPGGEGSRPRQFRRRRKCKQKSEQTSEAPAQQPPDLEGMADVVQVEVDAHEPELVRVSSGDSDSAPVNDVSTIRMMLVAHEYTGIFAYASEELPRLKRIGLLYTRAALVVFFSSVFYVHKDSLPAGLWVGYGFVASLIANMLIPLLKCLLRSEMVTSVSMNEEENIMRKKAQMRLWVMNIVAMAFVGVLAAVSFILANLWASGKRTEDTYQMVYTFVIAFGFDVLILQVLSAVAQALIVRYEGLTGREGDSRLIVLLRMLVNRELAAMILQPQ